MKISQALNDFFKCKKNEYFVLGMPEDGDAYHFSKVGCQITPRSLAGDVCEVEYVILKQLKNRDQEISRGTVRVCFEILDAYHNGNEYTQNARGDWELE